MKHINIPEPCTENWNEMTPNEKGAFCQKCALDVYDFTDKTADQIREILRLNIAAPVCMRIEPKQLDELNADFSAWKMNTKQSYHRAWVFTLFVVFGLTLFSCGEDEKQVVEKFHRTGQDILSSSEKDQEGDVSKIDANATVENSNTSKNDQEQCRTQKETENLTSHTMGKPVFVTRENELHGVEVTARSAHNSAYYDDRNSGTVGVPLLTQDYSDYLEELNQQKQTKRGASSIDKITGLVYPNPASNETTLKVDMPRKKQAEIELYSFNGQKIRTIHSGRIKKGESEFLVDLSDLETGVYLVIIYSGELKETIKFSKI